MDKKGDASEGVLWVIRIFILVISVVALTVLVESATSKLNDTHGLEYHIYSFRPIFSDQGISYYDSEVQRLKLGVVDLTRFNDETLEKLFSEGYPDKFGMRLTLEFGSDTREIYYLKDTYERLEPLLFDDRHHEIERKIYVKIWTGESFTTGKLTISLMYREDL